MVQRFRVLLGRVGALEATLNQMPADYEYRDAIWQRFDHDATRSDYGWAVVCERTPTASPVPEPDPRIEKVARAICESDGSKWGQTSYFDDIYRRYAESAIAALAAE